MSVLGNHAAVVQMNISDPKAGDVHPPEEVAGGGDPSAKGRYGEELRSQIGQGGGERENRRQLCDSLTLSSPKRMGRVARSGARSRAGQRHAAWSPLARAGPGSS